jgi:RHS repeat-associated protein
VTLEHAYNAAGQRVATRTSTGVSVTYERDLMGNVVRVGLPGGGAIERTWDALGREVARTLPGGAHIVCTYDGIGTMTERRVVGPEGVGAERGAGEPAWAGRLPRGTTFAEGWVCSPGGELLEHATSDGDQERFAYDAAGRVLSRTAAGEERERYAYEGTGRLVEPAGAKREYGPGGRLLSRGDRQYAYDAEGRRVGARGAAATRYEWNGRGMLSAVVLPDGTRVEHTYDTQGRRVLKRVCRPDRTVVETRFVWAGDDVIQETTWRLVPGESPSPLRATTYIHDDAGSPLAHRETRWTEAGPVEGDWVHHALGPGDLPELLVAGDGAILARMRATAWGRVEADPGARATTPWRFPGQYFDEEAGLCYNRYRFYDPEIGLYISADPLGLQGGLGAYEYARGTPFRVADPEGLLPVVVTVSSSDVGPSTGHSRSHPERSNPNGFHPVVWNALPKAGPAYDPNGGSKQPGSPPQAYPGPRYPPHYCGEPVALSNHIRTWEERHNGGVPLDPKNPKDREKIQKCLGSITTISARHDDGTPRAPCANCSQMLANLQARWGAPATSAITPGYGNSDGTGPQSNYTPPHKTYLGPRRQLM